MTAEIAVLNNQGVALAADSAVTITTPSGSKIFNTANKLFRLANTAPVGIMVNNAAMYMSVPWETIIKTYRREYGEQNFDTLQEHADDFIDFLDNYINLPDNGRHSILNELQYYLAEAQRQLQVWVEEYFSDPKNKTLANSTASKQLLKIIESISKKQKTNDLFCNIPANKRFRSIYSKEYRKELENLVLHYFPNFCSDMILSELVTLSNDIGRRGNLLGFNSGIIIAGFGTDDLFPQLCDFEICSMIDGTLRHRSIKTRGICPENHAIIAPFAQQEVVHTFLSGVHPDLARNCPKQVERLVSEITTLLLDSLHTGTKSNREKLDKLVASKAKECLEGLGNRISQWQQETVTGPVIRAVAHLPLDELAQMAESLVTMTALRRKISLDPETVGGAVDVAVISKGDGFVWMNRKHYFNPKLNDHFFHKQVVTARSTQ